MSDADYYRLLDEHARLIAEQRDKLARADARIAELEADASRYRWLRHQNNREEGARLLMHKMNADAAIDSARAGNGGEG